MNAYTECRAVGVVPNANVTALASLLRGMCSSYGSFNHQELVLKVCGVHAHAERGQAVWTSAQHNAVRAVPRCHAMMCRAGAHDSRAP